MAVTPSNSSLLTPDDTEESQLTISRIVDPNGVSIINRTTYQTSFKLSGINAERNSPVWIMYGNEKLAEATSNNVGEWETLLLDAPKLDCYNVFAEGRWADNPTSPPRRFTVATETPIINAVLSDGQPITDGDTIRETSVTINCNARPNQNAEVLNGDTSLKTELTTACGICTFKLEDLEPGAYNITVKGTDGKVSTPFKFTVIVDVITPATLDKVTDLAGIEIPKNTTTSETSLYVEGEGKKGEKVEIFNGVTSLGEAPVDTTTGRFKYEIGPLADGPYNLTAVAKWPDGGTSDPYPFTVAAIKLATLDKVTDLAGIEIAKNTTTSKTSLYVEGEGKKGEKVEIFNGLASLGEAPVDTTTGRFKYEIGPLADGPYNLTAVAKWPDGGTSDPYPFTVAAIKLATLDKVTDLAGIEIPKNTTTSETSLYVEGEGKKGEKVEIFNGLTSLGEATVDAVTGRFKYEIGPLADGPYNLTAVAKWPDGGTSDPYPFTVEAATIAPTETRIYDFEGEVIANGGDIAKSWFIARGLHTPNSEVKIKLNGVIQPNPESTNGDGKWAFFKSALTVGNTYEISALTLDGKAESNKWSVVARPPS
ncbi:hypothetical protein J2Y74_001391 [Pseudomonas migulae]|uniref:hypothetical protein n=1 Tax=Pseudomonas migulae TaxID=78543 RepID=UPI0020A04872|nr:hypothetical protein [Pseudomonas migulae]MCP1517081.1 hypothetical protein [Pseudomonas migulae]